MLTARLSDPLVIMLGPLHIEQEQYQQRGHYDYLLFDRGSAWPVETMDIIIVGAGIAGLGAGVALRRAGHNVTVGILLPVSRSPRPSNL